jgi:hypothetical protein
MRPRIVIPVLAVGLLVVLAAWLLGPGRSGPTTPNQSPAVAAAQPEELAARPNAPAVPAQPGSAAVAPQGIAPVAGTNAADMASAEAQREAYVAERVNQLMDLALDNQPASLEIILSELTNRDPEIRQAAVQAAMQFDSREAIPRLREVLEQTEDTAEKAAITQAIEFLEIPTPSDAATGRGAATAPANRRAASPKP